MFQTSTYLLRATNSVAVAGASAAAAAAEVTPSVSGCLEVRLEGLCLLTQTQPASESR